MSTSFVGAKHTVADIYPLRRKKVLLLVDPQNIVGETADSHATLDTITHLLNHEASVVIAASFGPLAGIMLNLSKKEREGALEAFRREEGRGYTNFFSTLQPAVKLSVLNSVAGLEPSRDLSRSTGKTTLFAGLSNQEKRQALRLAFDKQEFPPCSTYPFVDALQERFPGVKVHFAPDCLRASLHIVAPREIMVLENLRFYQNEQSSDPEERQVMAEVLASEVDLFVNDSFSTAGGCFASNVDLPRLMQHGAAGQSMDRELAFYANVLSHPRRPLAVVVAGTNIAVKLRLIRSLVGRVERILVAGAVAYPFLMAKGLSCGLGYPAGSEPMVGCDACQSDPNTPHHFHGHRRGSKGTAAAHGRRGSHHSGGPKQEGNGTAGGGGVGKRESGAGHNGGVAASLADGGEEEVVRVRRPGDRNGYDDDDGGADEVPASVYAGEILELCEQHGVEIVLPVGHVVTTNPDSSRAEAVLVESTAVPSDVYAVDCDMGTVDLFLRVLRDCRTVFWTGALGWVSKGYTSGTKVFAVKLGEASLTSIVGGRCASQAVMESGVAAKYLHVSSGGVSSLEMLQGSPLPGIEALSDVTPQVEESEVPVNQLMRRLPMFTGCNSQQLKVLARKFLRRTMNKGDYLLYRGDRHVCLTLVAQGGLVARSGETYTSAPSRYILEGMTASTYSFVTQAPAMETIRAAQNGTVVYQLFTSALNELLNAHPDLAVKLFQNLSEPLRVIANEDYRRQQSNGMVVKRNACRSRVPVLATIPANSSMWKDILQDLISCIALQRITMRFTPFVPKTDAELPVQLQPAPSGAVRRLMNAASCHEGLGIALVGGVVRNVLYHHLLHYLPQPWMVAVVSSAATAPLRLLAYGIKYNDINFKLVLDEGLIDAAVGVVPILAYGAALEVQSRVEKYRKRAMHRAGSVVIMGLVKLLLGFVVFPVVYQRNFVYTQPSASRFWESTAFQMYELKQVLSLLLRYVVHRATKVIAP